MPHGPAWSHRHSGHSVTARSGGTLKSLEQIVHEATGLEPAAQEAFLRQCCEPDSDLYSRAIAELGLTGDHIRADVASLLTTGDLDDAIGEVVGPYRLVRRLGEGGMGVVFLAERIDDQFRQQVAIKLVRHN